MVPTANEKVKMTLKVRRNGGSLIATIPDTYVQELGIEEGDRIRGHMAKVEVDKNNAEPN